MKNYIDPTIYENPNIALQVFTNEVCRSSIKIEQVIGKGTFWLFVSFFNNFNSYIYYKQTQGEFGEVCKAIMLDQTRIVAVKRLRHGYHGRQKDSFLEEASIMGQFNHPNVVKLEGVVTKSDPYLIVMEYMSNGALDYLLHAKVIILI